MATQKQQLAVNNLVENGGNISQAMLASGYSPNTAHTPSKLTHSHGYRQILAEFGLTPGRVVSALVQDIEAKPAARIRELTLAAELLGMKKGEVSSPSQQININMMNSPKVQHIIEDFETKLKAELTAPHQIN